MSENESGGNNNLIALTIAVLAAFVAVTAIKGSNVAQAMEQASAERNNSWAWYQAVRVREDMATYELAHLERLQRTSAATAERARLAAEITAQHEEIGRVRARKDEVQARAQAAEADYAGLSGLDNQYDLSSALISIAMALLAVCLLLRTRWLYWFSLLPGVAGFVFGAAAMAGARLDIGAFAAWLN